MSEENVGVVRKVWDAYSRGDYDRVAGFHDPHVVVITLEDGAVYGYNAVLANHERWDEAWKEAESTLDEVIGAGTGCSWRLDSTAVVERAGLKSIPASMRCTCCVTARFCA